MINTININGTLLSLNAPLVMAIINVTDDSFYAGSRCYDTTAVLQKAEKALQDGADILDVGACSTRPQSTPVPIEVEWQRVRNAIEVLLRNLPDATLSLDTFRSEVAERALGEFGSMIINDVSGLRDVNIARIVARAGVPYVLTHSTYIDSEQDMLTQIVDFFVGRIEVLNTAGVKDIIIDPGFGFNKNTKQNWQLLSSLDSLNILDKPILAGISRKRMIQEVLACTPDEALNGTTAAHIWALARGAKILRVHDVKEAKQAITIYSQCKIM